MPRQRTALAADRPRPLSVPELLDTSIAVAQALSAVHEAAIVHGNISLDTILIGENADDVVLCGFAAARPIKQSVVCERTDLFALGAVLYQLSTGVAPGGKLTRMPPAPKALRAELPQALSEIVIRLLAREPASRYSSAEAVAADLSSARELYNRGELSARFELGRRGRSIMLQAEEHLIGRSEASRRVLETFASALGGERRAVALEGPSGIGKTALVEHLRPRLESGGAHLTAGKFDEVLLKKQPDRCVGSRSSSGIARLDLARDPRAGVDVRRRAGVVGVVGR